MRVKTLQIDGYKNLDAKINHASDLITIIGNNGSGKSNLLEAISIIFRNLYNNDKNISFDFYLEYVTHSNKIIKIEKIKSKLSYFVDDEVRVSISEFLPKKVVAIYSGEEDRMWRECYQPSYRSYIENINKQRHASLPQMLYLNKFYWNIALLCLCLSENNKSFVKDVLGISKIDKIKFQFSKSNYSNYTNNPALNFVNIIDGKSEYTLPELSDILNLAYTTDEIFSYLYIAFTPDKAKIIDGITIMFNEGLTIEDLSEGQKKLLLIKAALEFAGQEDTVYLLDEPDAHVHVMNKEAIKNIFDPYKSNRQIIFTTHSPTLVNHIDDESLYMLSDGEFISKEKQEKLDLLIGDSWNKHKMGAFLSSRKNMILLVEGKHDKIHIENALGKLKNKYAQLDFEIFSMGGESKIRPFMTGLYETNAFKDKTYIAIFDNDKIGNESYNKGFKDENGSGYKVLKQDGYTHDNFFAIILPKPNGYTQECTIENMFDAQKYEDAYKEAVLQTTGYFGNKSIAEVHDDIVCKSKNILAENSKSFSVEEFKCFDPLFDLIEKIRKRNNNVKKSNEAIKPKAIGANKTTSSKQPSPAANPRVRKPAKEYKESDHLKNKPKATKEIYQDYRDKILSLNNEIQIMPCKAYIAFNYKDRRIADIVLKKEKIKLYINAKKGTLKGDKKLTRDVSKIGHLGNGDYEITITNKNDFDYIITLIKQVVDRTAN